MGRYILITIISIFLFAAIGENWALKKEIRDAKIYIEHYQSALKRIGYEKYFAGQFVYVDPYTNEKIEMDVDKWKARN